MANNFVQPGHVLTLTAPSGGVVSGAGYLVGALFVVALNSAAEGSAFEGQCTGAFELPKPAAEEWAEGAAIYWDSAADEATTESDGNHRIGHAAAAAATSSTHGVVRLSA